jgi:hypothetical protein
VVSVNLDRLGAERVELWRRAEGARDAHNVPTVTYTGPEVVRGILQQQGGTEAVDGRLTQVGDWVLVLPPDVELGGNDRVVARELTFEVVGPPNVVRTGRGPHHVEARLRHVAG